MEKYKKGIIDGKAELARELLDDNNIIIERYGNIVLLAETLGKPKPTYKEYVLKDILEQHND